MKIGLMTRLVILTILFFPFYKFSLLAQHFENITLQQVESLILENNQYLLSSTHRLKEGYYFYKESKSYLWPNLAFIGSAGSYRREDFKTELDLQINQSLYNKAAYYGVKSSKLNYDLLKIDLEREICDLLFEARSTFFYLLLSQQEIELNKATIEFFKEGLNVYEKAVEFGHSTAFEINQIKLDLNRALTNLSKSEKQKKLYANKLLEMLSLPSDTTITIQEEEISNLSACEKMPSFYTNSLKNEEWEQIALKYRPEIKKQEKLLQKIEVESKKQRAEYLPTVNLFANIGHCYEYRWNVNVEVDWTLFDGWKKQYRKKQSIEANLATEYQFSQLLIENQMEIARLLLEIEEKTQTFLLAQQGERIAQEGIDLAEQKHKLGILTLLEYREAIHSWHAIKKEVFEAKVDFWIAYYQLVSHCGLDLMNLN